MGLLDWIVSCGLKACSSDHRLSKCRSEPSPRADSDDGLSHTHQQAPAPAADADGKSAPLPRIPYYVPLPAVAIECVGLPEATVPWTPERHVNEAPAQEDDDAEAFAMPAEKRHLKHLQRVCGATGAPRHVAARALERAYAESVDGLRGAPIHSHPTQVAIRRLMEQRVLEGYGAVHAGWGTAEGAGARPSTLEERVERRVARAQLLSAHLESCQESLERLGHEAREARFAKLNTEEKIEALKYERARDERARKAAKKFKKVRAIRRQVKTELVAREHRLERRVTSAARSLGSKFHAQRVAAGSAAAATRRKLSRKEEKK